jgi:hypothetical protein
MKATLRSSLAAAAMILAPVGAMLVAQPAAAQHAYGYSQPAVVAQQDFRGDRDRWDHDRWDRRDHGYRRDDRGPWIGEMVATQGGRGWTRISARFGDQGSGVDFRSVVLRVDGRDVTQQARIDGDDIRFADDLRPGRHVAELVVRDRAGNATRRSWTFDVAGHYRHYSSYDAR